MDFGNFDKETSTLQQEIKKMRLQAKRLEQEQADDSERLDKLLQEINALAKKLGRQEFKFETNITADDLNLHINRIFPNNGVKVDADKQLEMQSVDYIVAALCGGLAVIVDAFLVKVPKDMAIVRNGNKILQEGSPLTGLFRSIGMDENGKAAKWVETLEKWFKVGYDKSIDPNVIGLNPSSHRLHNLAHDPSLLGFFFAIKDTITGTFTCIDRNGCLVVEKIAEADFLKLITAPIMWLGHLLSDIFTKMGIPIPGWCYLQLMQFGSVGEKQRTISDVARYMYLNGYDLRHFVSMSTVNAVIELVVRVYYFLVCKRRPKDISLEAEKEYIKIKNNMKLHNMLFVSYAVASCGNIAKICAYQGNPAAFNLPLWLGMIKEAIVKAETITRNSKYYEEAIKGRHIIDENFDYLFETLKMLQSNMPDKLENE